MCWKGPFPLVLQKRTSCITNIPTLRILQFITKHGIKTDEKVDDVTGTVEAYSIFTIIHDRFCHCLLSFLACIWNSISSFTAVDQSFSLWSRMLNKRMKCELFCPLLATVKKFGYRLNALWKKKISHDPSRSDQQAGVHMWGSWERQVFLCKVYYVLVQTLLEAADHFDADISEGVYIVICVRVYSTSWIAELTRPAQYLGLRKEVVLCFVDTLKWSWRYMKLRFWCAVVLDLLHTGEERDIKSY